MRPSPTYPTLRERVERTLLAAGFSSRRHTLPTLKSGGTFDLVSGAGVEVRVEWWDATSLQRWGLLGEMKQALEHARFTVTPGRLGLYVADPEKRSDEE